MANTTRRTRRKGTGRGRRPSAAGGETKRPAGADDEPLRPATQRRRDEGSVVTYSVAAFMLVALLVYLTVAFFADDSTLGDPVGTSAEATTE